LSNNEVLTEMQKVSRQLRNVCNPAQSQIVEQSQRPSFLLSSGQLDYILKFIFFPELGLKGFGRFKSPPCWWPSSENGERESSSSEEAFEFSKYKNKFARDVSGWRICRGFVIGIFNHYFLTTVTDFVRLGLSKIDCRQKEVFPNVDELLKTLQDFQLCYSKHILLVESDFQQRMPHSVTNATCDTCLTESEGSSNSKPA